MLRKKNKPPALFSVSVGARSFSFINIVIRHDTATIQVTLRHLSSVDAIHALQAHQGGVSDFDVCGNKLITCGCSPRFAMRFNLSHLFSCACVFLFLLLSSLFATSGI